MNLITVKPLIILFWLKHHSKIIWLAASNNFISRKTSVLKITKPARYFISTMLTLDSIDINHELLNTLSSTHTSYNDPNLDLNFNVSESLYYHVNNHSFDFQFMNYKVLLCIYKQSNMQIDMKCIDLHQCINHVELRIYVRFNIYTLFIESNILNRIKRYEKEKKEKKIL